MQRSAIPYMDSLLAIEDHLGLELVEIEDWNCCGATEYSSINRTASHALVGRNLALAEKMSNGANSLVAACSACYLNLSKTDHYMQEDDIFNHRINDALSSGDLQYDPGSLDIRHALDVFYNDIGIEKIKEQVVKPLKGLRLAAYYGCMVVRPDVQDKFHDPEYPTVLEELLEALGAEVVDFPMKTHCCSGHMTQISAETAYELIRRLIYGATRYDADMLVTLCPMCQLNIDAYQNETNRFFKTNYQVPILYFTQLIGLAFGIDPVKLGIGREFVDSRPALAKIGVEIEEELPIKKPKKKDGLPMPEMPAKNGRGD
ncbi:MAG: disulfide reductase [Gammaproteobacteria bacterium]|nr:disulfide reductase [Gammaproteobacteria bacterium]